MRVFGLDVVIVVVVVGGVVGVACCCCTRERNVQIDVDCALRLERAGVGARRAEGGDE